MATTSDETVAELQERATASAEEWESWECETVNVVARGPTRQAFLTRLCEGGSIVLEVECYNPYELGYHDRDTYQAYWNCVQVSPKCDPDTAYVVYENSGTVATLEDPEGAGESVIETEVGCVPAILLRNRHDAEAQEITEQEVMFELEVVGEEGLLSQEELEPFDAKRRILGEEHVREIRIMERTLRRHVPSSAFCSTPTECMGLSLCPKPNPCSD